MADPVITDHFRVLAVFERPSGLPRDRVIHTWAFRNDGALGDVSDVADNVQATLDEVYNTDFGLTTSIHGRMSPALTSLSYRVYDLGQAPPREPTVRDSLTWTAPSGSELPGEVAVCLSYVADRNLPRSRGRIYFGPLGETAINTNDGAPRPSGGVIDPLVEIGNYLLGGPNDLTWVLISQADAAAKVITGGWVDNAFDTQRRRGVDATDREQFGSEVPS